MSGQGECPDNAIDTGDVLSAIEWAILNTPAKVYNMSFGAGAEEDDSGLARVIDYLADVYGVTIVVAAGNSGEAGVPAIGDTGLNYNGITVANWDTRGTLNKQDDLVHYSSSRGPTPGGRFKPDVAAPGAQILSASHDSSGLARMTGTSMASPKVAGLAAVLHQAGVTAPAAVKALLVNTSDHLGWRADRGWGFVNMETALANKFIAKGEVEAGRFALYRGRSRGALYATLAWNRHVSERGIALHDLDLAAYDAEGRQLAVSETAGQNVEQVGLRMDGDVILKVKAYDESFGAGIARERFALAISGDAFTPARGPALEAACSSGSSTVNRGATFTLTCVASNNGELAARDVRVQLNWQNSQGGPANTAGTIGAGEKATRTYTITAPQTPGAYALEFDASASAFGESIGARALYRLTVR
jgi:hypothetical protein